MNIRQIEYFLEVAKNKNYTKAAENLYVSQSAITKQILLLEEELGMPLFKRNNKGVKLTLAGEMFYQDANIILSQIDNSQKKIQQLKKGITGYLNLGYVTGLEKTHFIDQIYQFYQEYPSCLIDFYTDTSMILEDKLLKGQLDLVLTHRYLKNQYFENVVIFQNELMVFVASDSPYSQKKNFCKNELVNLPIITHSLHDEGMRIDHSLLQIMGHKGVAILPQFALEYSKFKDYVIGIPIQGMKETTYAVYKKDNDNPMIKKIIEMIKEE